MHIWDEVSPALCQLDVYTCSEMDPNQVLPFLEVMEPTKVEYKFLDRESKFEEIYSSK
jgi:S-adenosylmethionine/arginine decarboxylase-like enzyme